MSNLDNLVAEILQQAQKEANRILTKTKAENLEFIENENKKIQREVDIIEQKSKEEAISLKERILSNANLKSRDMILQAKEELVDKVLEKALERLKNIDKDSYLDFIKNALKSLNVSKNAEIILAKNEAHQTKGIVLAVMVETYAVLAFVMSLLLLNQVQF